VLQQKTPHTVKGDATMASVKSWKFGDSSAPAFPNDFEIVKKAVLQVTDIKTNHNKYYGIELQKGKQKGKETFRVFTHYGRTDDLETNPNAGQKECRYADSLHEAMAIYQEIYGEKTSPRKGYKEVSLASSNIGSQKARGTSSGDVDAKTLKKLADTTGAPAPKVIKSHLDAGVQNLVTYIYNEATNALTTTVQAKITARGIETPLGILTLGQIDKGEEILHNLYDLFKKGSHNRSKMEDLSSEFYSAIPHRIGRTRTALDSAVIDSMADFQAKQETLQLMKDMLTVNGSSGSVLYDSQIDAKYNALSCQIGHVESSSDEYKRIADHVLKSQMKTKGIKVVNVYTLRKDNEHKTFTDDLPNQRLLFHGSRIKNWVGILSRGILMPKIVVSMGVGRTDAGWLGNGIYFGDASCTSAFYTDPGKLGTRFMAVVNVALGKMKPYKKITYGINEAPSGFHSCHGVRSKSGETSDFSDDEYVIYDQRQQRLDYLVEFKM
jgi:poly [ADP-ribose] polymerase 2/3/4